MNTFKKALAITVKENLQNPSKPETHCTGHKKPFSRCHMTYSVLAINITFTIVYYN